MCININYYTYSITITLRSTQRHLHELIILSGAYTQVSVNNSRFAYSLTAHILFAVLITEGAINFKPSPCCWRIQASDGGSVIIFVRASGKGTCYNAQTDVELLDTETEINLGIDKLNFTHTHVQPLRLSLRPLSLSLSSPISIRCSSFLSCSSLSLLSWELVFLFCSMFSMFLPISSKSLSSAELLSVSVDNTSVDSNTLKHTSHSFYIHKSIVTLIRIVQFILCNHFDNLIVWLCRMKSRELYSFLRFSLVLQVKNPLALLFVTLLMFCYRESRPTSKFTHRPLPWTSLFSRHGPHDVDHLPTGKFLYLNMHINTHIKIL